MNILPRRAYVKDTAVYINGEEVLCQVICKYNGAHRKKGSITIEVVPPPTVGVRLRFQLFLRASVVWYKVAWRECIGRGSRNAIMEHITSCREIDRITISGQTFRWDANHTLVPQPNLMGMLQCRISNMADVDVHARIQVQGRWEDVHIRTRIVLR